MKKKLLFTTALVAAFTATNAYAMEINTDTEITGEEQAIETSENFIVSDGKLVATDTHVYADGVEVTGGTVILNDGASLKNDDWNKSFKLSGGTIIMNGGGDGPSIGTNHASEEESWEYRGGKFEMTGGNLIVNGSENYIEGGDVSISGGTVDIAEGATLQTAATLIPSGLSPEEGDDAMAGEVAVISRFSGKPFDTSTIHRILSNKFYIGEMLYKNQWYKHNYETLIAPALFKSCQDIMHGRKPEEPKHFKTTEKPFIFRGLITCGECGCMISSDRKTKPSGKEYVYLKCSHFKGNCNNPQVNENVVLQQIEDELKNLSVPQEIISYLRSDMEKIINRQNEAHNREIKAIRKKYDDCQNKIKRLRSLLLEGHISPEEYRDMNEDLKNEQYELEGKSELLTEADEKFSIAVATILSLGNNAYQIFQSSKVETKREILHILLSNLKLQDRKISYTLRKPYDYIRSLNKKIPSKTEGIAIGDPNEIRTRIATVKGWCPNH